MLGRLRERLNRRQKSLSDSISDNVFKQLKEWLENHPDIDKVPEKTLAKAIVAKWESENQNQADHTKKENRFAELSVEASRSANTYAQLAIRTAFLLNGGALLALPALVKLTGISTLTGNQLHIVFTCFIGGLLFAAVSAFLAYLSMSAVGDSYDTKVNVEQRIALKNKAANHQKYGILAFNASIILFFIGSAMASQQMLERTNTENKKTCQQISDGVELCIQTPQQPGTE